VIRDPRSTLPLAALVVLVVVGHPAVGAAQAPRISINNSCAFPVWVAQTPNPGFSPLSSDNPSPAAKLNSGQTANYTIPQGGWGGRFWPKNGCDESGNNCLAGSSVPPCPPTGCEPPGDTKVEFFYAPLGSGTRPYYDISLVDGYTLSAKVTPSTSDGGRCTATSCAMAFASCPRDEILGIGDLRVVKNSQTVQCLSPCKKWNSPPPYGMGKPERQQPGEQLCCPHPPVTPGQCQAGPIEQTKYVALVRGQCPSAYSYSFDDKGGSHDCPPGTSFEVVFCSP
jgi:Thaumatin family